MTQLARARLNIPIGIELAALLCAVIIAVVSVVGMLAYRASKDALSNRALATVDALATVSANAVVGYVQARAGQDLGAIAAAVAENTDLGTTGRVLLYAKRGSSIEQFGQGHGEDPVHPGVAALVASAQTRGRAVLRDPVTFAAYRYIAACDCDVVVTVAARDVLAPLHQLRHEVIAAGLAFVFLGLGLAYLAGRRIAGRFRTLRRQVERIADGDLDHRITLSGNDELGQLGAAVETLAGKLIADASERKRSQRSLFEREEQYRLLFEDSRDAILITRPSGDIVDANQATLDLLGYPREQLAILHAREMYAEPSDWNRFEEEIAKRASLRDFEARFRTKDGVVIDCLFTATAQRDRTGQLVSYQSIIRDITRQKRSEKLLADYNQNLERRVAERTRELSRTLDNLKTAHAQLVESEKMAALGALVAGVAHEINTPIGVGVTAASTLEERSRGIEKLYEDGRMRRADFTRYLRAARQSSEILLSNLQRAAELISSFKQVAVDQSSEQRRAFAIQGYLQEVLLSLHPKLKRTRHTIDIRCDDSLMLESYPGAFSQVVTNLVMNSLIHAFGPDDEGHIVFDIHRSQESGRDPRIIVKYSDDGSGIPEDHLGHVFEPFFSTKRGRGGSGLGLHIVYNLVTQRLGGTIRCHSRVGVGTEFIIEMPADQTPLQRNAT
ncbi:MAG: ATP-binding protein [Proteobacteria bacterium]|nr:ATP-binding protein [Pseudomonadota bacterium]